MRLTINKLSNIDYDIIETDDEKYVKLKNGIDSESILGLCDVANQKIYIHKDISMLNKIKTLKHEIAHALLYEYCLSNDSYTEEQLCDFVSVYGSEVERLTSKYLERRKVDENV